MIQIINNSYKSNDDEKFTYNAIRFMLNLYEFILFEQSF